MADISRSTLFGKLTPLAYKAIEGATVFCKLRGNPYVELVHWLHQIMNTPDSDLHRIVRHFELDASALASDLTAALDRLPRGATAVTDLSEWLDAVVERGWVYATLMCGEARVRTGHLVLGALKTKNLRHVLTGISRQFERIAPDTLAADFARIVAGSPEDAEAASAGMNPGAPGEASGAIAPAALGRQDALRQYTVDLTAQAREGGMDPIVGRDDEIRQVIDILMRRRQNNPILVGEAGVGKTAVVEGLAQRIVRGDVPPALREVQLRTLDVGLLQAGASMKGEFEQRLRAVIDEVQASPQPIVLFVDETHTLVGAGGAAGTGDAANLLKPALARGSLRTIGATTFAEYKKYIEKDPALTRRFQTVQVAEPDEARALRMMRGVADTMERHHRVRILDEALEAVVRLSHRYIPARQLPDKAVSLLDTACARVAVSLHATPPAVDDVRRRIESLQTELGIVARERAIGIAVGDRGAEVDRQLGEAHAQLGELEARWAREQALVGEILALRERLSPTPGPSASPPKSDASRPAPDANADKAPVALASAVVPPSAPASPNPAEAESLRQRLSTLQAELAELQGEAPLMLPLVDHQAVAQVVGDWTGIPVGRMARNEIDTILQLDQLLARRIVGQPHALSTIARRIQTSRAGLDDPRKPVGVFLLAGTSGVGKTETALALAETLYGGEHNLITINMSEFQEAHTVSTLKGAPPGYVGYGEGGVLTEAVRRRPYSVVLLDEVEKAHPDVHEIFFQVFDKGFMEDGEGRFIDFKNTLILLTTNAGSEMLSKLCQDRELMPEPETLAKALREPLLKVFPPALLGRLVVVPYVPLDDAMMADIVRLQLGRIRARVQAQDRIPFEVDEDFVRLVVSRCTEAESGGRVIDAILSHHVLPRLATERLQRLSRGEALRGIRLGVRNGEFDCVVD